VLWEHQAASQVQAGLVPTKSGLLFAGDTRGTLLVFKAKTGEVLRRINTGGVLNSGLISYAVAGQQYVAAAVGGATENPSPVAGPLKVSVYGLYGSGKPQVVTLDRLQPPPAFFQTPEAAMFAANCGQCHGSNGQGNSAPPLLRQSQLADPELLKIFLATVPPPMPHLYPGVLEDKDVEMIAAYLRTSVFKCDRTTPPPPQRCHPPAQPLSGGTPAWQAVYAVLTSPRCINCHPVRSPNLPTFPVSWNNATYPQDYPRQGDDRHPHLYGVLRGDPVDLPTAEGTAIVHPGQGPPFERCTFCHGNHNDPVTGIPGAFDPKDPTHAPFWALAPAEMAWESAPGVPFTSPELCAQLKDPNRNGHRELSDILAHLKHEPLVNWAFNPGPRPNGEARTTPPISHDALIRNFEQWMTEGAPCPHP
jgi:mono/diheme cytochrome c family protein